MFFSKKNRIENELVNKFLSPEENRLRVIKLLFFYLLPYIYIYLFLVLNEGEIKIFETRGFFYLSLVIIALFSYVKTKNIRSESIELASSREYKTHTPQRA